jgi:hypothetical protein
MRIRGSELLDGTEDSSGTDKEVTGVTVSELNSPSGFGVIDGVRGRISARASANSFAEAGRCERGLIFGVARVKDVMVRSDRE